MRTFDSPPYAPILMESTRAIGYTIEAAVADLIDNSITAEARNINIKFMTIDEPYISILDDGKGMHFERLKESMNYGSSDPMLEREEFDMGRYGLGLKTASLSQCRKLIVVSMADDKLSAFCWDLDFIKTQNGKWSLKCFDENEIKVLPQINELIKQGKGTLVIWQNLDRICNGAPDIHRTITAKIDEVRKHLQLTFHRFLSGENDIKKIKIYINNDELKPSDPFLVQKSTILMNETIEIKRNTSIGIKNAYVTVTPYILPHLSQMSNEEINNLGGIDGLINNQGFYIYRNKRLLLHATWFKLARKIDTTKLCRVKVDLPNSLDTEWSLDIKKSMATPPEIVVQNLSRIIGKIIENSKRVYAFRGRKEIGVKQEKLWLHLDAREGKIFVINKEHPLIKDQIDNVEKQSSFFALLALIESEIPINQIISYSEHDKKFAMDSEKEKYEKIKEALMGLLSSYSNNKKFEAFNMLKNISPFNKYEFIFNDLLGGVTNE